MQTGALAAVSTRRSKRPHAVTPVSNAAEIPHRPLFRCAAPGNEPGKQTKCAALRMTGQHPERPDRSVPCAVPGNKPAKQPTRAAPRMTGQHPGRPNRPAPHAAPKSRAEDPFSERCTACKPAHWRRSARGVCHFLKKPGSARKLLFSSTPAPCSVLFCWETGPSCCHTPRGPVIC